MSWHNEWKATRPINDVMPQNMLARTSPTSQQVQNDRSPGEGGNHSRRRRRGARPELAAAGTESMMDFRKVQLGRSDSASIGKSELRRSAPHHTACNVTPFHFDFHFAIAVVILWPSEPDSGASLVLSIYSIV
jgi:hypothetical protein